MTQFSNITQLGFERHTSVHRLSLHMWGDRNHIAMLEAFVSLVSTISNQLLLCLLWIRSPHTCFCVNWLESLKSELWQYCGYLHNAWLSYSSVSTEPEAALPSGGGCGLPLGGAEETSGYKGYGLGLMVEIFCGILSGSAWGPSIRKWKVQDEVANLGQCFIALDPGAFTDDFNERMQVIID